MSIAYCMYVVGSKPHLSNVYSGTRRVITLLEIDINKVYAHCSLSKTSPPDDSGLIKAAYVRTVKWARWTIVYAAILSVKQRIFVIVSVGSEVRANLIVSLSLDWSTEGIVKFDTGIVSRPSRHVLLSGNGSLLNVFTNVNSPSPMIAFSRTASHVTGMKMVTSLFSNMSLPFMTMERKVRR